MKILSQVHLTTERSNLVQEVRSSLGMDVKQGKRQSGGVCQVGGLQPTASFYLIFCSLVL